MKNPEDFVLENIKTWTDELIAKSRQSRQIDLRVSQSTPHFSLDFARSKTSLSGLLKGQSAQVISMAEYEELYADDEVKSFLVDCSEKTMVNASKLNRGAQEALFDSGLETLYVAIGQLHWKRADERSLVSPLLFLPVRLTLGGRTVELVPRDDGGIFVNTALQMYLKSEHDFDLPFLIDTSNESDSVRPITLTSLEDWLKNVRKLAKERGWLVPRLNDTNEELSQVCILPFTFTLEAIYKDIKEHESELANSELVQSLVAPTGRAINLNGNESFVDAQSVDQYQPAEDAYDIFMSDSSQRVCIDAARKGMSFVIQGPPGTGKTQTITNIVSNLLHDGKSVLFVADKATALDAVHGKLKQRGLDSFVLRFQDGKVTAKSFANQLNGILESALKEVGKPKTSGPSNKSKRIKLREQLNAHAVEGSRIHHGFELPVSEIIGLATRSEVAPVPQLDDVSALLQRADNRDAMLELWDYAGTLATKWEPVEFKETSLWYSLTETVEFSEVESIRQLITLPKIALEGTFQEECLTLAVVKELLGFRTLAIGIDFPFITRKLTLNELYRDQKKFVSLNEINQKVNRLQVNYPLLGSPEIDQIVRNEKFAMLTAAVSSVSDKDIQVSDLNSKLTQYQQVHTHLQKLLEHGDVAATSIGLTGVETWADVRTISDMHISSTKTVKPSARWLHPRRLQVSDIQRVIDRVEPLVDAAVRSENVLLEVFATPGEVPNLSDHKQIIHRGNSWIGRIPSSYKRTLDLVRGSAYSDISHTTLLELVEAFEERKRSLAKLQALTVQLPELSEYQLSEVSDYVGLISVLKESRAALADVNNRQNALLNASHDSALYYGQSSSSLHPGISTFVASVERLFEIQATDLQLKLLLGKTTIARSITEIDKELKSLREIRESLISVSEISTFSSVRDIELIIQNIQEMAALFNDRMELAASIRSVPAEQLSDTEIASLSQLLSHADGLASKAGNLGISKIHEFVHASDVDASTLEIGISVALNFGKLITGISDHCTIPEVIEILDEMLGDKSGFNIWSHHQEIVGNASKYDAGEIVKLAKSSGITSELLPAFFKAIMAKLVLDYDILKSECFSPEFASSLDSKVEEFRKLDESSYAAAAKRVFTKASMRSIGTSAEIQSLIKDRSKNSRLRIPIRTQLFKLGPEVLDVAPVVMASPINVSKYLPDSIRFDYVIFDEASQLYPAFALSSLYRAKKAIIAGDDKQMPPPQIIGGMSVELEDEDFSEETVNSANYESLLDFASRSASFPESRLLWHYRSRNESLIAFSNHEFYKGDLYTFPSQFETHQKSAVRLEFVENGVWYKSSGDGVLKNAGPAGTNPVEAERVASDVQAHAHFFNDEKHPAFGKSLMVIATGKKQADAIEVIVNHKAASDDVLSEFLANQDPKSRFTIKNLETAQGDERDYVFLSFAYNQRSDNNRERVIPNFGPLRDAKGWRRLNVAITRARYQLVLYASCKASNIEVSTNESINHIRNFFNYAEVGYSALNLTKVGMSSGITESPFEDEVVRYIESLGYECTSQVGSAGYRLDIGVKHKDFADVFILGVECDGYMYHSSAVARDRDRIRQEILEDLGWTIHRIWGTRWYRYNENEKMKLKEILESQSRLSPKGILVDKR